MRPESSHGSVSRNSWLQFRAVCNPEGCKTGRMRLLPVLLLALVAAAQANPAIDMDGYLGVSREGAGHRETRGVSEEEFIRMSREPGTVVLEARSREKYDELRVEGAV